MLNRFKVIIGENVNRIFYLSDIRDKGECMQYLLGYYGFDLTEAEIRSAKIIRIM